MTETPAMQAARRIFRPTNDQAVEQVAGLIEALREVTDMFALPDENSTERFERLAAMFRKDTSYLAPGKDQPMCGPDQPDGAELRAIYDAWYIGKVDRARAIIAKATGA